MKRKYDILFIDLMVEDTHRFFCNEIISALNRYSTSVVIEKPNYIDYESTEKHTVYYISMGETVNNYPVKARVNTLKNYIKSLSIVKHCSFNKVIVLGYDPVTFSFMYGFLKKYGDIYLVEHHQLDEVSNSHLKRKIWGIYKNKVNHIILNKKIAEMAVYDFSLNKENVYLFPLRGAARSGVDKTAIKKIQNVRILSISNSNEIRQLNLLLEWERKTKYFFRHNMKLIIRNSPELKVEDLKCVELIDGYLSNKEYEELYISCDMVLMLFPKSYKYRCSGTLVDALSYGKKVISSNISEAKFYEEEYPSLCKTFNNIEDIGDIAVELMSIQSTDDFDRFVTYNSTICDVCAEIICNS